MINLKYITFDCIGLRILHIFKFLNVTAVFTKKIETFQSLHTMFRVKKLISVNTSNSY